MKNKTFKFFGRGNDQNQNHVPSKYDANLRKNGFLNFQVGLILSLLMVYGMFQINFPENEDDIAVNIERRADVDESDIPVFKIVPNEPKATQPVVQQQTVSQPVVDIFDIVDDEDPVEEITAELKGNEDDKNEPVSISSLYSDKGEDELDEMPEFLDINAVEFVPVFPGCEKLATNEEKTACLATKISRVIQRNFNTQIASDYGLSGKQRIYVQFKIDKHGNVTDIQSRAAVNALEKEANRVIDKLPQMTPGKQRNQNVAVRYSIPIIFDVK
ncbi:protein TonB [Pustulibacterium marinum]|uniref:Protein TonB n=1 Tax=Pustulibacterium marinum TaxID=1224947 RepID=A0A1I7H9X0_9FLAO|nr:energy transducer TonB [Pustulibacterium marinum]SFU57541.1 protein TonB [Pustulibacterium marinum]